MCKLKFVYTLNHVYQFSEVQGCYCTYISTYVATFYTILFYCIGLFSSMYMQKFSKVVSKDSEIIIEI